MMTRDNIIKAFRACKMKQITENKWQLENFIFYILEDCVTISGKFCYSLAKQICLEKFYPSELFVQSEESKDLPFEFFLTNSEIDQSLTCFSMHCVFIDDYATYSQKYNQFKLELVYSAIEKKEDLFLESITIKTIPALAHTILSIKNFNLE